jgi:hypothetical protein
VLQKPKLAAGQAWERAARELVACGCDLPPRLGLKSEPVLQLFADTREEAKGAVRLVYAFFPQRSNHAVRVGAITGEVGGVRLTYIGSPGYNQPPDPLVPVRKPQEGHDMNRLTDWVPGGDPLR